MDLHHPLRRNRHRQLKGFIAELAAALGVVRSADRTVSDTHMTVNKEASNRGGILRLSRLILGL